MSATIVRAAIHPAIGIARVGDSPDTYFIGPEKPGVPQPPEGGYRDAQGRLKRQAARFRVFGYDADGNVVRELAPGDDVQIEWTVQVANTKSSWYDFELAMDIPQATAAPRRNPSIQGTERARLEIRPTAISISGPQRSGPNYAFDDGEFMGTRVYLGELRTDEDGHLLFLGGHGKSASYDGRPVYTFANNDGWHDDVSDGTVNATVTVDGVELPVDPAWVVCAPPNYGPQFRSIVTLWELLTETMIAAGFATAPARPSFERDILPLLQRNRDLQWLNKGFLEQFANDGPQDFFREPLLSRLASHDEENAELRNVVKNAFRSPDYDDRQRLALPWIYGDGMEVPASNDRQWMAIPPHLYTFLEQWAKGQVVEATPDAQTPAPDDPGRALDRAALEDCLADAFHPGCEVTWPVRHASMYMGPYRILHRNPQDPEPDYGDELDPAQVYDGGWSKSTSFYGNGSSGGPLWGQRPGDITRWMAVPWQTDTASCRDGYESDYDEYVPTFWPARVPNQVLDEKSYETVMNLDLPAKDRIAAFRNREEWLRPLGHEDNYLAQIRTMIDHFGELGVVIPRPAPPDHEQLGLPATFQVEQLATATRLRLPPDASKKLRDSKRQLRAAHKAVRKARRLRQSR